MLFARNVVTLFVLRN